MSCVYSLIFIIFMATSLLAVDIGSDTAVNRFISQQILNDGDRIASFALLQAGFVLNNGLVSATYDTIFPVSGAVDLNSATLTLNKDVIFHNTASITRFGSIIGNNHIIEFAKTMTTAVEQAAVYDCTIRSLASATLAQSILSVAWSADDQYVAAGLTSPLLSLNTDLVIYQWNGAALTLGTSFEMANSALTVDWHPTSTIRWLAVGRVGASLVTPAAELYNMLFSGGTLS